MTDLDPGGFEDRYRALESELGAFDLGTSFLMLTGLGDRWLAVLQSECRRIVNLRQTHYAEHEAGPTVIRVGGGSITSSHDELTAAVAFVQGITFAEALRRERETPPRA
jgi:hypothetical protein